MTTLLATQLQQTVMGTTSQSQELGTTKVVDFFTRFSNLIYPKISFPTKETHQQQLTGQIISYIIIHELSIN